MRHGILAAVVANVAGSDPPIEPTTFMLSTILETATENGEPPDAPDIVAQLRQIFPVGAQAPSSSDARTPIGSPFGPDDNNRRQDPPSTG